MGLGRVAIITLEPAENVTNTELEVELRTRLNSKSFTIERIKILDDGGLVDESHAVRVYPLKKSEERD